jgi:hypothetical protein
MSITPQKQALAGVLRLNSDAENRLRWPSALCYLLALVCMFTGKFERHE